MSGKREKETDRLMQWEQEDVARVQMMFSYVDRHGESAKERVRDLAKAKLSQAKAGSRSERGNHRKHGPSSGKKRWVIGTAAAASAVALLILFGFVAVLFMNNSSISENKSEQGAPSARDSYDVELSDTESFQSQESSADVSDSTVRDSNAGGSNAVGYNAADDNAAGNVGDTMGKKIIYKADATVRVDDISLAMKAIENKVKAVGGYIANSSYAEKTTSASMVLKIPSDKYAEFNEGLATWGTVLNLTQLSEDIGQRYFDIEARLKAMEVQEQRYLEILKEAKTLDEILKVEKALNEIRAKIESYKGQLRYWDNQVDYSQVTLTLQRAAQDTTVSDEDPWQPVALGTTLEKCKWAVLKTVSGVWNVFNASLVVISYLLPFLVLGGVVWLVIWLVMKRISIRKRRENKEP